MFSCWKCDVTFVNCFIANNKQNDQYLFGIISSGTITVSNSFIDTTEKLYASGQNVEIGPRKEVSLAFYLLSTGLCHQGNYFISFGRRFKIKVNYLIHIQTLISITLSEK